jgi:carbamoyl-phosphate synthase large subunit
MADDIERLCRERAGALWQELLLPDDQEYIYRSRNGEIRKLVFRRKLQGGLTRSGEVIASAAIGALLERIAVVLDLSGSINVQLRLTAEGPRVFEINPRFSSAVGCRHKMGFRDFVWSLLERKGLAIEAYCPPRHGTQCGANEIIID